MIFCNLHLQVVEIVSSAIGDLMEAEFHLSHNENGKVVIPENGISVDGWKRQIYLSEGKYLKQLKNPPVH